MAETKAAKEAAKKAELARARMERAKLQEKIDAERAKQTKVPRGSAKWHESEAKVKDLEREQMQWKVKA